MDRDLKQIRADKAAEQEKTQAAAETEAKEDCAAR
jgi:hypothetical protein